MSDTERTWTTGDTEEAYKAAEQRLRSRLVLKPWPQCPACKLNMQLKFFRKEITKPHTKVHGRRRDLEVESVFDCKCWREEKAQEKKAAARLKEHSGDQTADDGVELAWGVHGASGGAFTVGDDPAFYSCATLAVADVSHQRDRHNR